MAKPSTNNRTGELAAGGGNVHADYPSVEEIKVDSESTMTYNERDTVFLRSVYDARLEYTGQITGKQYIWNKAGSVVEVDAEDSKILLAKRIGIKSCCGNSKGGKPLFELVI